MRSFYKFGLILIAAICSPFFADAQASLSISPSSGDFRLGTNFSVVVTVNSGGASINAATAQINFDHTKLTVVSVGYSQSIFTLWPQQPSFDNAAGTINFSGGVPSPGFTGADGALLRITFKPKALGSASLVFVSGSVLANDGIGTNIADNLRGAVYRIQEAIAPAPKPLITTPKTEPAEPEVVVPLPLVPPVFTDWPKTLSVNNIITVEGEAASSSKIILSISKDGGTPFSDETYTSPEGKFSYTMKTLPEVALYKFSAVLASSDGRMSLPSEAIDINVTAPTTFCIGRMCLEKSAIQRIILISIFLLLLLLLALLIIWLWLRTKELEKRQQEVVDKLSGVEEEFVTMIEKMRKLQTNDHAYRNEVAADIEKLTFLKDQVIHEISDLKNTKNEFRPEVVVTPTSPVVPEVPREFIPPATPRVEPIVETRPAPVIPPAPVIIPPPKITPAQPVEVVQPIVKIVAEAPVSAEVEREEPLIVLPPDYGQSPVYYDPFAVLQANMAKKASTPLPNPSATDALKIAAETVPTTPVQIIQPVNSIPAGEPPRWPKSSSPQKWPPEEPVS